MRSVFAIERNEMVRRRPLRLASEMRLYMLSMDRGSDEFSKYVVERKRVEKRWCLMRKAGKKRSE